MSPVCHENVNPRMVFTQVFRQGILAEVTITFRENLVCISNNTKHLLSGMLSNGSFYLKTQAESIYLYSDNG